MRKLLATVCCLEHVQLVIGEKETESSQVPFFIGFFDPFTVVTSKFSAFSFCFCRILENMKRKNQQIGVENVVN